MTVEVLNLQRGGGGSSFVTSFSDNFNRADTVRGIGDDYIIQDEIVDPTADDNPFPSINGNLLRWQTATASNQQPGCRCVPKVLLNALVDGKEQFAQLTYAATTSAGTFEAFWLFCTGARLTRDFQGYFFRDGGAGFLQILARTTDAAGNIIGYVVGTAAQANPGDIVRGEIVPSVGSNRVAAIVNGVKVIDVVDNNVARPLIKGTPALGSLNLGPVGVLLDLNDFSCGIGTLFI